KVGDQRGNHAAMIALEGSWPGWGGFPCVRCCKLSVFVVKGVEIPVHKRFFSEQTRYRRRRKAQRRREQREAAHAAHPLRTSLPFLCLSGVVLAVSVTAASCTLCYQVESQGQPLAFFQDAAT